MAPPTPRSAAARAIGQAAREVLELGEVAAARRLAAEALALSEQEPNLHSVMAGVLEAEGRHAEALPHWRRALALAEASPGHRFNLALALLRAGAVAEGLALAESRYDKDLWRSLAARGSLDGLRHRIPRPGEPLEGRRILVFTEQGLGDCLWAARWLPALARRGAVLSLAAPGALRPLLEPLAPFATVLEPPDAAARINLAALAHRFDAVLPLMSLPWLLGVSAPEAAGLPWLHPDPAEIAAHRARFQAAHPGRRIVGLVWQANPESGSGAERSVPLAELAPLADIPGVGLVALQGGAAAGAPGFAGLVPGLPAGEGPLPEFAAALAATDLLVSVDTMAMHLAGSMGHPALILVAPSAPGFVLGPEAERCGWYPSLRLLRRPAGEDWAPTIRRLATRLEDGKAF